ncbi:MAG: S1 RNA-binding domain-containing protein [Candidatus Rehaiarchaeum fermentans]|nr:S1 RNA-binding domain-containing protein [Candidatus Rehaiarchaeum fermentans]
MQFNEGEVIACEIEKILDSGVIVKIYETDIEGFVHVSELSKSWINNPNEVVKVGQILPAKIMNTQGQLELSLKRVSDEDKRRVLKEISIIRRLELILSGENNGENIIKEIRKQYGSLYYLFQNYDKLKNKFELSEETRQKIEQLIEKSKKLIKLKYKLYLRSSDPDGVEKIKEVLLKINKIEGIAVRYQKAPIYVIETSRNPKEISKFDKELNKKLEEIIKAEKLVFKLEKYEKD